MRMGTGAMISGFIAPNSRPPSGLPRIPHTPAAVPQGCRSVPQGFRRAFRSRPLVPQGCSAALRPRLSLGVTVRRNEEVEVATSKLISRQPTSPGEVCTAMLRIPEFPRHHLQYKNICVLHCNWLASSRRGYRDCHTHRAYHMYCVH